MRLNLGCGKHYKEGFINIDAFDTTIADKRMTVEDLAFLSNTIDAIEACQLIEHLGYIHTIYALAEWFRVLKPGGTLLIETPDIEASMTQYLDGGHGVKKETLPWLYGVESPGMRHLLCFPKVLVEDLLKKSGFTGITPSCFTMAKHHPVMRVFCSKQQGSAAYQIIAQYRKRLTHHHLVDFHDSILAVAQEKLNEFFLKTLQEYLENNDEKTLENAIIDGCIQSVPMTHMFFQECLRQKIFSRQTALNYKELFRFLSTVRFSNLLLSVLKEMPTMAGTQKKTIQIVTQFAQHSLRKIISSSRESKAVKKVLLDLSQKPTHDELAFFSETMLEYKAADLSYQALKAFFLKKLPSACVKWQEAIRLDRNHLLYYWNLGRVLMLTKKIPEAQQCYRDALTLVRLTPPAQRKHLETLLKKEHDHFSAKKHGAPVLDVTL